MFKVVCNIDYESGVERKVVQLKNCIPYEFSLFHIDGLVRDNSRRHESAKKYAEHFLEEQQMNLDLELFRDLKLAVTTSESLKDFRLISIIEESGLIRAAGTPKDYPYAIVFDTVIKLITKEKSFGENLLEYFFKNDESKQYKEAKYEVKWEIFYPLEVSENAFKFIPFKILKSSEAFEKKYYQYDQHFLKFLFGDDVLENKEIDLNQAYSSQDIVNVYEDYKTKLKEIVAIKFLQYLAKDKKCIMADGQEYTTFVDIMPRFLLDHFYKKNYFSRAHFEEMCLENFGDRLLTVSEILEYVSKVCSSNNNVAKVKMMNKPSELSNELLEVSCETIEDIIEDILVSLHNLPEIINEFNNL